MGGSNMNYRGKNIYITGGSSGIGLGMACEFLKLGGNVVLLARKEPALKEAVAALVPLKISDKQTVEYCVADVSDRAGFADATVPCVEKFGIPDVLVHSAGTSVAKMFADNSLDEFDFVMNTNLGGTCNTVRQFVPFMEARGGSILLVSSMAGLLGVYSYTAYCASKHGMVGFAGALKAELREKNINVSLMCPPEVDTPMLELERDTIPARTRFIKDLVGTLDVETVSPYTMKKLIKNMYLIVPGFRARLTYLLNRLFPGFVRNGTDLLTDRFS